MLPLHRIEFAHSTYDLSMVFIKIIFKQPFFKNFFLRTIFSYVSLNGCTRSILEDEIKYWNRKNEKSKVQLVLSNLVQVGWIHWKVKFSWCEFFLFVKLKLGKTYHLNRSILVMARFPFALYGIWAFFQLFSPHKMQF